MNWDYNVNEVVRRANLRLFDFRINPKQMNLPRETKHLTQTNHLRKSNHLIQTNHLRESNHLIQSNHKNPETEKLNIY